METRGVARGAAAAKADERRNRAREARAPPPAQASAAKSLATGDLERLRAALASLEEARRLLGKVDSTRRSRTEFVLIPSGTQRLPRRRRVGTTILPAVRTVGKFTNGAYASLCAPYQPK